MINIYESLENLNVSEECFNDIMGIVEELLSEDIESYSQKKKEALEKPAQDYRNKALKIGQKVAAKVKNDGYRMSKSSSNRLARALFQNPHQEKIDHLSHLQNKAKKLQIEDWRQMGHPRRENKNEKGAEKTENRRYIETYAEDRGYDSYDTDHPSYVHRAEAKGYPYNIKPKSDEQRVKDSIARHDKKNK